MNFYDTLKVRELLKAGIKILNKYNIHSPQLESEIFLSEILKKSKEWIIANYDFELNKDIQEKFFSFINRRIRGEPVAYIVGKKDFFSIKILINKNVLIPRPETEIVVETALSLIKKNKIKKVLEIGTGSGCISAALRHSIPHIKIVATDISIDALKVAKKNFSYFPDIYPVCCNLFNGLKSKFDMIISNPPYIKTKDLKKLPKEVREFEPQKALDGGEDGLEFYRKIITEGKKFLNKNGVIIFENGYISSIEKITEIFKKEGYNEIIHVKDYNNFPRVIWAKLL